MFRRIFQTNKKPFDANNYLTIEALEDNLQVSLTKIVQYCVDGVEWVILPPNKLTQPINKGQTISFKWNYDADDVYLEGVGYFSINKKCNLMGNCLSMIFGDNAFKNKDLSGYDYALRSLFSNCNNIISVSENFLPATTLAPHCYDDMFYNCTSLVNAPELPATTLSYACYWFMFNGCSNLNYIKMLATDISAEYCLYNWVNGVSSTGTFVKSKYATWDTTPGALKDSGVPAGWTVVNDGEEGNVGSGGEITFYVNEVEFKALDGMTWQAYVDSDYNYTVKDGINYDNWKFIISVNNGIEEPEFYDEDYEAHWPIYTGNYQVQRSSDKIIANKQYYSD